MSTLKELLKDENGIDSMTISDSDGNSTTITADTDDPDQVAADAVKPIVEKVADHVGEEVKIPPRQKQLSFKVGGEAIGKSIIGTLSIGGKLKTDRDLNLDDELRVQVVNSLGEVVAQQAAIVAAPAFIEQRDKEGDVIAIERAHKAKVE